MDAPRIDPETLDMLALDDFSPAELERFAKTPVDERPAALREASYEFVNAFELYGADTPATLLNADGEHYVEPWHGAPVDIPEGEPPVNDVPLLEFDRGVYDGPLINANFLGDLYVERA